MAIRNMNTFSNRFEISLYRFCISLIIGFIMGGLIWIDQQPNIRMPDLSELFRCQYKIEAMYSSLEPNRRKTLFIGMMSTKEYLGTRTNASLESWWRKMNMVDMEIFSEQHDYYGKVNNQSEIKTQKTQFSNNVNKVNVVKLPGVSDVAYPPQKKSFLMIAYMADNKLDQYEWFMRLDDDVYVNMDHLIVFLNKLNSSEERVIGSPGYGLHSEDYVREIGNYCMGGPGIIISRGLLRKLSRNIRSCLRNLMTSHEDIELGRCINKISKVPCTNSWEASRLFYQNYIGDEQHGGDVVSVSSKVRRHAITFHANKQPLSQFRLHNSILKDRINKHLAKINSLQNDMNAMNQASRMSIVAPAKDIQGRGIWSCLSDSYLYTIDKVRNPNVLNIKGNLVKLLETDIFKSRRYEVYIRTEGTGIELLLARYKIIDYGTKFKIVNRVVVPTSGVFMHDLNPIQIKNSHLKTKIHFIVLLGEGVAETLINLRIFLENFKRHILLKHSDVFVIFSSHSSNIPFITRLIQKVQSEIRKRFVKVIQIENEFSVLKARRIGANDTAVGNQDILFFCGPNLIFDDNLVNNIRLNTVRQKQVYNPIIYGQYKFWRNIDIQKQNFQASSGGLWWDFSYETIGIFKEDFFKIDTVSINQKTEDVQDIELADKLVQSDLQIFRVNEKSIENVYYHERTCHHHLSKSIQQLNKCFQKRYLNMGSIKSFANQWLQQSNRL